MSEAQLYPHSKWTPLGAQTQYRMRAHDILCFHTMVGYLLSTDPYFRVTNGVGFRGTESHYGVGGKWGPDSGQDLDGAVYQWQDRAFTADANLEGNYRVISVETADNAPRLPQDTEPWTPKQIEALAHIAAWESTTAAHTACPVDWACHHEGIPLVLVPDSKPGRRGVAYHRQGIDPWREDGGEKWSSTAGKPCPTDRRIAQIPEVIERAQAILAEDSGEEDDMSAEAERMIAELHKHLIPDGIGQGQTTVGGTIAAGLGTAQRLVNDVAAVAAKVGPAMSVVKLAEHPAQWLVSGGVRIWIKDTEDLKELGLKTSDYQTVGPDDSRWSYPAVGDIPEGFPQVPYTP